MIKQTQIIIYDECPLVAHGICVALNQIEGLHVAVCVKTKADLLNYIEEKEVDMVLIDQSFGDDLLTALAERIERKNLGLKIIIIGYKPEERKLSELISFGVQGVIAKESDFMALVAAIREVQNGNFQFDAVSSSKLAQEFVDSNAHRNQLKGLKLTEKEIETLQLICDDQLTKTISTKMKVTKRSVERYKTRLYRKTGSNTIAGLVLFALQNRLVNKKWSEIKM